MCSRTEQIRRERAFSYRLQPPLASLPALVRGRGATSAAVARGLDPRVHRGSQESFAKTMDCTATRACPSCAVLCAASRVNPTCSVKPGNDATRRPAMTRGYRSRPCPLTTPCVEIHRTVRDREPERRADGAFDQPDFAAMRAHQLGHDGEPEAHAAGAGRALEGLEQMRAGFLRQPRAGIGDLDHRHRTLAPAGDADLIAPRVLGVARLERLHRVAREIE